MAMFHSTLTIHSNCLQSVSLEPKIDTIAFWHNGAYLWLRSRHETKLTDDGKYVPDIWLDMHCFTWNLSTSM